MRSATVLHVDLDAFYASVEQLLRPELRGKPVLVGEGVVLAASYEARAYGVAAPMGTRKALQLCPHALVVRGSFSRYTDFSEQVMEICRDATPLVEQISIDEAFLDVSGSTHLLGTPEEIGHEIRRRVRSEAGLPISVGVASTKFLAKVASSQAKPDGLTAVPPEDEIEWLHSLPVEVIWGVGRVTSGKLRELGIATVGDLARLPPATLAHRLGPGAAGKLLALAWNRDSRRVTLGGRAGSVGAQSALGSGTSDREELGRVLLGLADRVAGRLRAKGRVGRTITVRTRFPDMTATTRALTLPTPVSATAALHRAGLALLADNLDGREEPVTLVAISVSHLEDAGPLELELPFDEGEPTRAGSPAGAAHLMVDEQVDRIRDRFGRGAVGRASVLLGREGSVPDDFRKLAERD